VQAVCFSEDIAKMRHCVKSCLVSRTGIEGVAVPLRGKKARLSCLWDCKRPSLSGGLEHKQPYEAGLGNPSAELASLMLEQLRHLCTAQVAWHTVYPRGSQALLDSN